MIIIFDPLLKWFINRNFFWVFHDGSSTQWTLDGVKDRFLSFAFFHIKISPPSFITILKHFLDTLNTKSMVTKQFTRLHHYLITYWAFEFRWHVFIQDFCIFYNVSFHTIFFNFRSQYGHEIVILELFNLNLKIFLNRLIFFLNFTYVFK